LVDVHFDLELARDIDKFRTAFNLNDIASAIEFEQWIIATAIIALSNARAEVSWLDKAMGSNVERKPFWA
jgi:hypothetical protein